MARLARFATIVVLALAALAAATVTGSDNNLHLLRAFEAFATKHRRHYRDAADKAAAFGHFRRRMAQAAELQARNPHATFGATKFADQPIRQSKPLKKPRVTPQDAASVRRTAEDAACGNGASASAQLASSRSRRAGPERCRVRWQLRRDADG
jgi:hypothetical protein